MRSFAYLLFVFILVSSNTVHADGRLSAHAKFVVAEVTVSFATCDGLVRSWHAANDPDEMDISKRLRDMNECQSKAPGKLQRSVQELRAALKAQGKSEAALKSFMMTYRQLLGILGPNVTNKELSLYEKTLDEKGELLIADIEW